MKFIQPMIVTAVFLLPASPAFPQGTGIEWDILAGEASSLYQNGKHDRAVVVAKKALEVAEKALGPDHPDVATSLNNLAILYKTQGKYAEAEPLYKRSLAIYEKAFGPDRPGVATHPHVATTLRNLAELYRETKREYEADELLAELRPRRGEIDKSLLAWVESLNLKPPVKKLTGARQEELEIAAREQAKLTRARADLELILIFSAILTCGIGLAIALYYTLRRGAKKGKANDSPPPVPQPDRRGMKVNRKVIAKEWLILILSFVLGILILPAILSLLFGEELGRFYEGLFREFLITLWLFVFAPYCLIQITRATCWSIKQMKQQ